MSLDEEFNGLFAEFVAAKRLSHWYVSSSPVHQTQRFEAWYLPDSQVYFDLASLTKALVIAPLVFLAEASQPGFLDASLGDWVPRFGLAPLLARLKIRKLLGHTSGLPDWLNLFVQTARSDSSWPSRADILERLNRAEIRPNQGQVYSDVGYILLGLGFEHRYELGLDQIFARFCRQNSLPETLHYSPSLRREACIPTGFCRIRQRQLQGEVHDENCFALGQIAGHAGLFATGTGLTAYITSLLAHPDIGTQLINAQLQELRPTARELRCLMGWQQGSGESAWDFGKGQAIGHLGFTGTAFWYDPETKHLAVFLSNRIVSGRLAPWITPLRKAVFQRLGALT